MHWYDQDWTGITRYGTGMTRNETGMTRYVADMELDDLVCGRYDQVLDWYEQYGTGMTRNETGMRSDNNSKKQVTSSCKNHEMCHVSTNGYVCKLVVTVVLITLVWFAWLTMQPV